MAGGSSSARGPSHVSGGSGGHAVAPSPQSASASAVGGHHGGGASALYPTAKAGLEQQQQVSICAQLDLQSQLHARMMSQRRTQHAIGWRMNEAGPVPSLSREQLQRLAQHVMLQRLMLQHLYSMLHACNADIATPPGVGGGLGAEAHSYGVGAGMGGGGGLGNGGGLHGGGGLNGGGLHGFGGSENMMMGHALGQDSCHSLLSDAASLFPNELVDPLDAGDHDVSSSRVSSNDHGNLSTDDSSSNADGAGNDDSKSYDGFGDAMGGDFPQGSQFPHIGGGIGDDLHMHAFNHLGGGGQLAHGDPLGGALGGPPLPPLGHAGQLPFGHPASSSDPSHLDVASTPLQSDVIPGIPGESYPVRVAL